LWLWAWVVLPPAGIVAVSLWGSIPEAPSAAFFWTFVYRPLLSLWGVGVISRTLASLEPSLAELNPGTDTSASHPFRLVGSISAPILLTLGVVAVFLVPAWLAHPTVAFAATAPPIAAATLPYMALLWTCGTTLLGLNRLGHRHLRLRPFEVDRSLGLHRFGILAFQVFGLFAITTAPALVTSGIGHPREQLINLGIFSAVVVLFFGSLSGLRRQLAAEKAQQVAWTRDLYTKALAPIKSGGPEALRTQALELQAAAEVERRALSVWDWPFDDRILGAIVAIVLSVLASILAGIVLEGVGL
jgi:hypothetical protein